MRTIHMPKVNQKNRPFGLPKVNQKNRPFVYTGSLFP